MKKQIFLALVLCLAAMSAKSEVGLDDGLENWHIDCDNRCVFEEFDKSCHGVAYKKQTDKKTEFLYTHYSKIFRACVTTIPDLKRIKLDVVNNQCACPGQNEALPPKDAPLSAATAKKLETLKAQIEDWAPCAPDPLTIPKPANDQAPFTPEDVGSCKEKRQRGEDAYVILGACKHGTYWNNCNYYGNTNNFAGPLCLAGDMDMCADIKKNQDPETGAFYRSAFQRRYPYSERGQPLFSRDEVLGILQYFAATGDKDSAAKWLNFLKTNPRKNSTILGSLVKIHNLCPPHTGERPGDLTDEQWKGMQPDDRCEMRPGTWGEMYKVYRYIGFSDRELKHISRSIYRKMKANSQLALPTTNVSTLFVPRYTYEANLQANTIYLYRAMGIDNKLVRGAANNINRRTGHESPFYHFLAQGNRPTEYGARLIEKFCPAGEPDYVNPPQGGIGRAHASFYGPGVHFAGGLKDGWDAVLPTGHECLGWINLYLNADS